MYALGEIVASRVGETYKLGGQSVAALALLAANAGMLFLYFLYDLTLFQVVVIYWWEALWIGLYSGLKLLTASLFGDPYENGWIEVSTGSGLLFSIIAIIKSGGVFLAILALTGVALVVAQESLTGVPGSDFVKEQFGLILKCSLVFFAGHGLSFVINFLLLGEFRHARFSTLLWLPFRRGVALFVTIVAALTATQAYPGFLTVTSFAAILILSKLAWDYVLHRRERQTLADDNSTQEPEL